jgi:hypothetical protein
VYEFSRAMYLRFVDEILDEPVDLEVSNHLQVLQACEAAIERLATDPHYFAKPTRTLFREIRVYFPIHRQRRVLQIVDRYVTAAEKHFARTSQHGFDAAGNPLCCRASTRKGTPCQRPPLPHNGFCPSHQHLAETEEAEAEPVAA